mgnify:CR=1 FL=1
MKKSKFVLLSLILIVLLGFSLFFVPVEINAASDGELDLEDWWEEAGLPLSALDFVDDDGKGIKFFLYAIFDISESGIVYQLASLIPVKDYYFNDGIIETGEIYILLYNIFFSDSLLSMLSYYLDTYGFSFEDIFLAEIPERDWMVISWDVDQQRFVGPNYLFYWIETSYNEGYDVGYGEGYDVGNEEGYNEGYQEGITENHEAAYYAGYDTGYGAGYEVGYDDARPEMDILLITLIMYILSIIIYFKFNLKWVLIGTTLLWFVPIFLVDNLFVKIFSVIMIIVTIVITFFGEREEEF